MTTKRIENASNNPDTPQRKLSQNRYRRDSRRREQPSATVYTHPRYVPQLRQMISDKMDEFLKARTNALEAIDQRIHEVSRLKHKMDPAIATELMVTLAEARAILLSLNPTARDSEATLADLSQRLQTLVKQQRSQAV